MLLLFTMVSICDTIQGSKKQPAVAGTSSTLAGDFSPQEIEKKMPSLPLIGKINVPEMS